MIFHLATVVPPSSPSPSPSPSPYPHPSLRLWLCPCPAAFSDSGQQLCQRRPRRQKPKRQRVLHATAKVATQSEEGTVEGRDGRGDWMGQTLWNVAQHTDYAQLHLLKILFSFLAACKLASLFFGHMNNKFLNLFIFNALQKTPKSQKWQRFKYTIIYEVFCGCYEICKA